MQITSSKARPKSDIFVVPVLEDERRDRPPLKDFGFIEDLKLFETAREAGVLFVGAGKRAELDGARARRIAGTAARQTVTKYESVAILLRNDAHAEAMTEGFVLGAFEPDLYRKERKQTMAKTLTLVANTDVKKSIASGQAIADSQNFCRTLVAEPPNELTPSKLAERATQELEPLGVKVTTMKGKQLDKFGSLLGVAKGSDEPPAFISMSWEPARAKKSPVLGLVGKGITFDSGGLSLKTADGMTTMKSDMAGAAAAISAMRAIAALRLPINVKAAVPTTENMPGGHATRVGDVLRAYSGKTIEVLNTDAEGRLVLADALAWLAEQGVTHMVDAATLTGAVSVALGRVAFGVMGRPDRFVDRVLAASRRAGEKAWPLPLYDEYRDLIKSDIADVKNVGTAGGGAGTIVGAWFLAEFVPQEIPWAHLDIAGVAMGEGTAWMAKGPTGAAVRAFVQLARDMTEKG
jgi:leucyl aminopeptidase